MNENDDTIGLDDILSLFLGRCGHQWVKATGGSFGCPVCGDHDGDHHRVSMEPIPVQPDDWRSDTWEDLRRLSEQIVERDDRIDALGKRNSGTRGPAGSAGAKAAEGRPVLMPMASLHDLYDLYGFHPYATEHFRKHLPCVAPRLMQVMQVMQVMQPQTGAET